MYVKREVRIMSKSFDNHYNTNTENVYLVQVHVKTEEQGSIFKNPSGPTSKEENRGQQTNILMD